MTPTHSPSTRQGRHRRPISTKPYCCLRYSRCPLTAGAASARRLPKPPERPRRRFFFCGSAGSVAECGRHPPASSPQGIASTFVGGGIKKKRKRREKNIGLTTLCCCVSSCALWNLPIEYNMHSIWVDHFEVTTNRIFTCILRVSHVYITLLYNNIIVILIFEKLKGQNTSDDCTH